jgi:hypothetical protein
LVHHAVAFSAVFLALLVGITTKTPVHCHYGCTGAGTEMCCRRPFHSSRLTNDSFYCCGLSYGLFSTHARYRSY